MEDTLNIELSERMYKRVEWLMNLYYAIKAWFISHKPKRLRVIGVEFLTEGKERLEFHIGEKHHIDNHRPPCTKDMHCLILPIKRIIVKKDKVKIIYEGDHEFVYSQVSIRTTYLKKV